MRGKALNRLAAGLVIVAAGTLGSAACAAKSINHVLADPSRYHDREVRVSGFVVDSHSIATQGAYALDHGTGRLWIVTARGTPRRNTNVSVNGTIRGGFNLGAPGDRLRIPAGVEAGLVMVESSRKARS